MRRSRAQLTALGVGCVLAVGLACVATLYLSALLFLVANKRNPLQAEATSFVTYWKAYRDDAKQYKRLVGSLGVAGGICFLVVPGVLYGSTRKKRPLHGEARFANAAEIRRSGLLKCNGILVGKHAGKYLALSDQRFVLLAAPTRGGKGVGVVIPNLLAWPDSVVVLDIKGENYQITAGYRAKHGQRVFAFQPFDEDGATHRYNPLSYVRKQPRLRVGDLQTIASAFYSAATRDDAEGSSKFWNEKARDLFVALALYLMETPALPLTLGELLRQSSGKGKPLKEYLQKVIADRDRSESRLSEECVHALDRFLSNPDNTLGNILSTFTAPLTIFADPIVDAATSGNDFSLCDLRKERLSIYLIIPPPKHPVAGVLVNLFFSQLVALNTRELPADNPALRYQCLLLMDEFTSMGRVAIMAKAVGYLAGYNLRFLTIVQSMSQLAGVYGKEDATTFASNHALQILFAPKEQQDAQEFSNWLGTFTEKAESKGRSRHIVGSSSVTASTNVSDQRRPLLLPQELRELGSGREIVMLENCKPILCDKIAYYEDKVFMGRLLPAPIIPVRDHALHEARLQQRKRDATPDELADGINLEVLAHDLSDLPTLDANAPPETVSAYVDAFFSRFPVEGMPAQVSDHEPENRIAEADENAAIDLAVLKSIDSHEDIDLAELEY